MSDLWKTGSDSRIFNDLKKFLQAQPMDLVYKEPNEYADPFNLFQREYDAQFGISTSKPEPTPMELTRSYKEAVKD